MKKKDVIAMGNLDIPLVANLGATISSEVMKLVKNSGLEIITDYVIYTLVDNVVETKRYYV